MNTEKTCNKCRQTKPLTQFTKNCKSPDGRLQRCKPCDKIIRLARYRTQPETRAKAVWWTLLQRVGNANGKNPSYATVSVLMTQKQFVTWYSAELPKFFAEYGSHATPSVDRRDGRKDYSLDNVRMIPLVMNSRLSPRNRNVHAPEGQAWCNKCQVYKLRKDFYPNSCQPHGLQHHCKECDKASHKLRKKSSLPV